MLNSISKNKGAKRNCVKKIRDFFFIIDFEKI